jgi:hypothetical protein
MAAVESLVDRRTWVIDDSTLVKPPKQDPRKPGIFAPTDIPLWENGVGDRLLIHGHFYSDKSPLPALYLAGVYATLQKLFGITAKDRPDLFCYWLTVLSVGAAYVAAVWCVYRIGLSVGLSTAKSLLATACFGLATMALPYLRHVNQHLLLLAATAAICLELAQAPPVGDSSRRAWRWAMRIGLWMGLGYTIDLGVGPILVLSTTAIVAYQLRQVKVVAAFLLASAPPAMLHHAVNYSIGGTFFPANSVVEYVTYPGSTFTAATMTGGWQHDSAGHLLLYLAALLFGKKGFIGHNLPLFLIVPGTFVLLARRPKELPMILYCIAFAAGSWILYGTASTNYSGACCSIRWFVPLLAPGFFLLALCLREEPEAWRDLAVLGVFGSVLGALMWSGGPWTHRMVPYFWQIQGVALAGWGVAAYYRFKKTRQANPWEQEDALKVRAAA